MFYRSFTTFILLIVLLFSACSSTTPTIVIRPVTPSHPPSNVVGPALTNWYVEHTLRPKRDLLALAKQFGKVSNTTSLSINPPVIDYPVNSVADFWVQNSSSDYVSIQATLVYTTTHAYFYVENGTQYDLKALKSSADLFENSILPTDHRFFGQEATPSLDGDAHITVLNASDIAPGELGYFSAEDEYPASVFPYSNQRNMIYAHIGSSGVTLNTDAYNGVLAHELQHLIHANMHPTDPAWINEGMSVLAQHINGLDIGGLDQSFFASPSTQLNTWSDQTSNSAHYGAGYLFMDYFAEHYGGYNILKELLSDPTQSPDNFDDVLAAHGYTDRFNDVFAHWVMTNALNDVRQGQAQTYQYKTIAHEHVDPQNIVETIPYSHQATIHQYAADYFSLTAPSDVSTTLHLSFTGQPTVPLLSAGTPPGQAWYWWSNRGDTMNSTLTRDFDLTHVKGSSATLQFQMFTDLETSYDYGYVEVSIDGGATWSIVPVTGCTTDNPNGNNYGCGLTGFSAPGQTWTPVSVDLSSYIGKHIAVRFQTITDDSVNGQGMAIAGITLPAIGYVDSLSTVTQWQRSGWMPITTDLAEQYIVQVATIAADGSLGTIQRMIVQSNDQGTLDITDFGQNASQVIIAVSAIAPATTVDTTYTLNITAHG